jgi:hypothetical protein
LIEAEGQIDPSTVEPEAKEGRSYVFGRQVLRKAVACWRRLHDAIPSGTNPERQAGKMHPLVAALKACVRHLAPSEGLDVDITFDIYLDVVKEARAAEIDVAG